VLLSQETSSYFISVIRIICVISIINVTTVVNVINVISFVSIFSVINVISVVSIFIVRDDVKLVRAFDINADGLWFNPGSEGFFRASYYENG
jgi:hypothetical protein